MNKLLAVEFRIEERRNTMGDVNDAYFKWSDEQDKKRNLEIDEKKKYLAELSLEEKVEVMFKQFSEDEIKRIWSRYCT